MLLSTLARNKARRRRLLAALRTPLLPPSRCPNPARAPRYGGRVEAAPRGPAHRTRDARLPRSRSRHRRRRRSTLGQRALAEAQSTTGSPTSTAPPDRRGSTAPASRCTSSAGSAGRCRTRAPRSTTPRASATSTARTCAPATWSSRSGAARSGTSRSTPAATRCGPPPRPVTSSASSRWPEPHPRLRSGRLVPRVDPRQVDVPPDRAGCRVSVSVIGDLRAVPSERRQLERLAEQVAAA